MHQAKPALGLVLNIEYRTRNIESRRRETAHAILLGSTLEPPGEVS
jgi:hypothetical protein